MCDLEGIFVVKGYSMSPASRVSAGSERMRQVQKDKERFENVFGRFYCMIVKEKRIWYWI